MARTAASTRSHQTPGAKRLADIRRVADLLKRVSDPTRVQVLLLLNEQERKVSELCAILGTQSPPALSHHLSLLRHGHLIEPIRTGKFLVYRLTEAGESLVNVIEQVVE